MGLTAIRTGAAHRKQGGPPGEGLLFLRLRQMPRLGRFSNSQKSEADFLISVFLNSGRVLYPPFCF